MGHKIWDKTQYHGHGYGQDNQQDQAREEHGMVASATMYNAGFPSYTVGDRSTEKQRVSVRGPRILFLTDNNSNELKGHNEQTSWMDGRCTALAVMNCTGLQTVRS